VCTSPALVCSASDEREFNQNNSMTPLSLARRVRGRFMSFGLWISAVGFVVIEGDALLDQPEIGHASALFMFGTACLAAAASIALFATIVALGLVVSSAFSEEPHQQPGIWLAPGRLSTRRPHQQGGRTRTVAGEVRRAPSRALGAARFRLHGG
jgi:hypothetical protein